MSVAKKLHLHWLYYDIPEDVNHRPVVENPSYILRRRAIRINLSCWVIPQENIPWRLLNSWTAEGVNWGVHKFDESEAEKLLVTARNSLRKAVEEALTSCQESVNRADSQLHQSETDPETDGPALEKAQKRHHQNARGALKRVAELLRDVEEVCRVFSFQGGSTLDKAWERARVIQDQAHARAVQYGRMIESLDEKHPLKAAALADDLPPGVLADALEEQGHDVSAARAAFAS